MTTAGDSPFNRRRFLLGGGVFGLGLLGASCSSDSSSGGAAPTPPSEDVWSVLKTLRELARSSPDHLAARFAEAIAAKSPENLVRLVQERVRVLPTDGADVLWSCRWGASGALRAAAGTPRERMDLLAAALKALGAVTRVVSASLPASVTADGLYRDASPVFALDAAKLASLRGSKLAESLAKLPTSGTEPDPTATAEKLLRAIPVAQATAKHRAMQTLPSKLPVVEFTLAGVTRWAYAIADLGIVTATPEGLTGELTEADIPSVSLRVLGALGDLPSAAGSSSLTELVSGTWRADRVAGRKVVLTFPPPGDPRSGFGQKLESVPIRVPSLVLTEPDPPGPGQAEPFSLEPNRSEAPTAFTGAPIAMTGARFVAADSTGNVVNGPYGPVTLLDEDEHALALARVASVDFEINAGAFPDIEVRAAVLDANGAPINGLSAPDFALSDQGKPQGATLLSNTAVTDVRVLLAYDGSSSVTWPTPAAREAFDTSISQAFVDATTQAPFSLCVAGLGSASGPWSPPDATAIRNALSTLISSSPVWGTLGSAALAAGVSAVVVVSDFDADDDASTVSALRQRLGASGLAVALVPVGNANQATIAAVVEACGALVLDPNANDFPAQLAAFVSRRTLEIRSAAYRLRYRLPDDAASAAAARTVTLTCGAQPLTQSHDYVAPATGKAGLPPGIGGLYLEVTANGATSTRRLSGPRLTRFGVPERPFSAEDIAETKHLLSGLVAIAFEPGSPTTAANLEDVLSGVLSTEPASKAVGKDASAVAEAGAHFQFASGSLGMLAERAPSNARAAVPSGVRVVIQTMFVDEGGLARRFDIVPAANRVLGVGTDEAAAFRAAVVASVVPSQREASVSPGSAYARLATAELRFVAAFENPQALEGFTPADLAAWRSVLDQYGDWHRLVPTSPSVGALWVVDPDTGTSVAVLLDGSGGASHSCTDAVNNAVVQAALQVVSLYATYKSFVCELAQTGGTLPCVGATVATVYAAGAALFTAAVLDSVSYADVVLLLIGMVTTQFPAAYGGLLSLASLYVAKQEVADSLYEHC